MGGHKVQLTSLAPRAPTLPHIPSLLDQQHDIWEDAVLQSTRWASCCVFNASRTKRDSFFFPGQATQLHRSFIPIGRLLSIYGFVFMPELQRSDHSLFFIRMFYISMCSIAKDCLDVIFWMFFCIWTLIVSRACVNCIQQQYGI